MIGNISFGISFENGKRRVPIPPAVIKAVYPSKPFDDPVSSIDSMVRPLTRGVPNRWRGTRPTSTSCFQLGYNNGYVRCFEHIRIHGGYVPNVLPSRERTFRLEGMVNVAQIATAVAVERTLVGGRPTVRGKFLYVGKEKFWVRGVSYGTFFVDDDGEERLNPEMVARDFALMAANGFNVVRVHTGPPRWLLDMALENGLRVMVGLNWGEHMAFLDEPGKVEEIIARVRKWIRTCAGHPAVFCYSIGNEIPAAIVRWHGRQRVEKFIERLYRIAKEEDPDALVTYVNYPSTEYLRLPFLDFVAFSVYLESPRAF